MAILVIAEEIKFVKVRRVGKSSVVSIPREFERMASRGEGARGLGVSAAVRRRRGAPRGA